MDEKVMFVGFWIKASSIAAVGIALYGAGYYQGANQSGRMIICPPQRAAQIAPPPRQTAASSGPADAHWMPPFDEHFHEKIEAMDKTCRQLGQHLDLRNGGCQ